MKYIVEFEDEPCLYEDEVHFYKCIQAPWWGLSERVIKQLTPYQPDHNADVSKKVDMMHEYIYKIVKDCDGVNCYIKQGKIIRCKDCKHRDKYGCCKYWKGLAMGDIPIATDDYDFCSYAKRI